MNKREIRFKDTVVSGFALFAIFFGAGNLILPPHMGMEAGRSWGLAWLGFSLSGPILTALGMIAMAKKGGDPEAFAGKVSPAFSLALGASLILCIGPLLSVPRTAATTFEISVQPFFPGLSPLVFSLIFFALTYYFSVKESRAVDVIGAYMTPLLLLTLAGILVKGFLSPGEPLALVGEGRFGAGFIEGYHTMDSLGIMVLAGMIISNFREKGIKSAKDLTRHTIYAELIAASGLILVYGGLTYLGAKMAHIMPEGIGRTDLLKRLVYYLLGDYGSLLLGFVVAMACITTAIGLTCATGDFFAKASKGRLKYDQVVLVAVIVSAILSIKGVEGIIAFSMPLLTALYPVVIALTLLNLLDRGRLSHIVYKTTVLGALAAGLVSALEAAGLKGLALVGLFARAPFWEKGFGWVFYAGLGLLLGLAFVSLGGEKNHNKILG